MRPLGYLYKRVARRPNWLKAGTVEDVYSLSNCISKNFWEEIAPEELDGYWGYNGFGLFDSPDVMHALAARHGISLEGQKLFYYEAHVEDYDAEQAAWVPYEPDPSLVTNVIPPKHKTLEGFDITTCFMPSPFPECSPLSCNGYAENIETNAHCLFNTFEDALHVLQSGPHDAQFFGEPGPYRIVAVYSIDVA